MKTKVKIIQDIPVSYLPSKPFRTKIESGPSEVCNLTPEHIKALDKIIKEPVWERDEKGRYKQLLRRTFPKHVITKWDEIKGQNRIFSFCFKKLRFRHPKVKGKLIYAFTFWPLSDIICMAGRHREMHGFFLDPPWGAHIPPPKKDWVEQKLQESVESKEIRSPRELKKLKRKYVRAYDRMVDKRQWINVIWVPTKTNSGISHIFETYGGIQTEVGIMVGIRKEVARKLVHYDTLEDMVESQELVEKTRTKLVHRQQDDIRKIRHQRDEAERREKMKGVGLSVASEFPSKMPTFEQTPTQLRMPPKPSFGERMFSVEELCKLFIGIGVIFVFLGIFLVGMIGLPLVSVSIIGAIFAITGLIVLQLRKPPEIVKEKIEEVKKEFE